MGETAEKNDFVEAHFSTPRGMKFFASLASVLEDTDFLGYYSVVERAWKELKLDGVLFQDGRPVLYLKTSARPFEPRERARLQKLFWNQGVANVLVLAAPTNVHIHSGLTGPCGNGSGQEAGEASLVETIERAEYVLRLERFFHALATGRYYEESREKFDPEQSLDSHLLNNLKTLRDKLIDGDEKLEIKQAHSFIGRVLFLCYLLDREIVSIAGKGGDDTATERSTGTAVLTRKLENLSDKGQLDYLYALFESLKEKFNGNMFDQDLAAEKELVRPFHMRSLVLFLGGHDVESGQLGFWPYDFKMIPVETISAIYQDFLATEDRATQRKRGAFYTPRFLAEMVVDTALRDDPELLEGSFLDPACGSGIFLVILFNRIAHHLLRKNGIRSGYAEKAEALRRILANRIRGIDLSETACRIASFSLYLAYLDFFDPPDIQKHVEKTGRPLPKMIQYGEAAASPPADIPVIHKADFLAGRVLEGETFGCVIGNPPWEGRGNKQIAQKFTEEIPRFLRDRGVGCLLLPTKILQNKTDAFQSEWLSSVTIEKVVQLADYRFLLFQNAKCPAFIARFRNEPPQKNRHSVEFVAPKFQREGRRQGIVAVNPSDRTWIPLGELLAAAKKGTAPVVWKKNLWGSPADKKILSLLQSLPALDEHVDIMSDLLRRRAERTKRWIIGQGIKPWPLIKKESESDRPPKKIAWPPDTPFISAAPWNSDLLSLKADTISLEKKLSAKKYRSDVLYSQPSSELFRSPLVLVSQGFGKVAYCDFDAVFQHSLQSIGGPPEDAELLMFLAVYLRSRLARFYLFHTVANWGSERDKVHLFELLRLPFPLPGHEFVSRNAEKTVELVARRMEELRRKLEAGFAQIGHNAMEQPGFDQPDKDSRRKWNKERKRLVDESQEELEPLIYKYFGLTESEIAMVEDTNLVSIPSATPTNWHSENSFTLDRIEKARAAPYNRQGLSAYADALTGTLNAWATAEASRYRVRAKGGVDEKTGLAMVTVELSETEEAFVHAAPSKRLFEVLQAFREQASNNAGTLLYHRDVLLFHGNKIHVVRPDIVMNWTRSAAINDAARIYGEIATAVETSQ